MRFTIKTLVDITKTNARRGEDKLLVNQQANYNTLFQTIGLRVNAEPVSLTDSVYNISKENFGDSYKGKQRVWEFIFDNPYEGALTEEMLIQDFNLIPIIDGLNDTASFAAPVFYTDHPNNTNIIFTSSDK